MFNFFRRQPQQNYTLLARYRTGHWFKRFEVQGVSAYEAARRFDLNPENDDWTRVSGATIETI